MIKRVVSFALHQPLFVALMSILFIGQQPYTGGTNGITNLTTIFGLPLESPRVQLALFLVELGRPHSVHPAVAMYRLGWSFVP